MGPKVVNFDKLFLHWFSSRICEILHRAVLTPQKYESNFFVEKKIKKNGEETQKTYNITIVHWLDFISLRRVCRKMNIDTGYLKIVRYLQKALTNTLQN